MRAALAVKQGGVLLGRVEIGRQDHPRQHLLAVGGLHPAFLHLAHPDVVVNRFVDGRKLRQRAVGGVDAEELGGHRDRAHFGDDPIAGHREGVDVVVAAGYHLDLAYGG